MSGVHPTAIVEDGAELHESVTVGPHSIIEAGAVIGPECRIESCVRIFGHTRMGRRNRVCHGSVLGTEPQDLAFDPARSRPLVLGDDNHLKEGVNLSRGLKTEAGTVIGDRNYLMGNFHAGHDCRVGDDNILGHGSMLAGHVEVGDGVFISGLVAIHQFCRIGSHAIVAGQSAANQDVPPYSMVQGSPARFVGANGVGLKRAGFTSEQRSRIKQAYRLVYRSGLRLEESLASLADAEPAAEVAHIIAFIEASERGIVSARERGNVSPRES